MKGGGRLSQIIRREPKGVSDQNASDPSAARKVIRQGGGSDPTTLSEAKASSDRPRGYFVVLAREMHLWEEEEDEEDEEDEEEEEEEEFCYVVVFLD